MSSMNNIKIKELSDSDWREYKSIRLKSLQDSPDSFASTFEREVSFEPEQWKSRLQISPSIHDAIALSAIDDQSFIGLLSCVVHAPDTETAHLYQMWVSPQYRGMGVGTALLDRVKQWAISRGSSNLLLSVTTINFEAISLYRSIGFYSIGNTEPLRDGSNLRSQTMSLKFDANDT